jgi:hypothetical protein
MFGLLNGIVTIAGSIVGSVIGLSATIIAATLNITVDMAQDAVDAGCTTYAEIRNFHKL